MRHTLLPCLLLSTLAAAAGAPQPRELSWDDLVPPPGTTPPAPVPPVEYSLGERSPDRPQSPFVHMYPYNPVKSLDGQYVKLPGYVVPLESDEGGLLSEFLLVPWFGACIHVPPPPSNQIVFVRLPSWRENWRRSAGAAPRTTRSSALPTGRAV